MIDDTIAAIGTPIGAAGIGIIRISGDQALEVAERVVGVKNKKSLKEIPSHSIVYGHVYHPDTGSLIDEVLVSVMLSPRSFTAENVVEINCHGGIVAVRRTLEAVIAAGARIAEPGEFSKRAFLNGRIDLAQAESIMDLINAKTESSLRVAVGQLEGKLSKEVKELRRDLLSLIARIEAGIDFPEHDIEELTRQQIRTSTLDINKRIEKIFKSADSGKILREGLKTVIVGRPNVGKSSLLNALVKEQRAIVTDVPGTTRDIIEEVVSIKGIPLKILDTAGIRDTEDKVEKIGVEKSREVIGAADLYLLVIDASLGVSKEDLEIASMLKGIKGVIVFNKIDLIKTADTRIMEEELGLDAQQVSVSAAYGHGMDELEKTIEDFVYKNEFEGAQDILVSNVRHKEALEGALRHLTGVMQALDEEVPIDCMSIDLQEAWQQLGRITGETVGEDIVDQIFSQFCIGK